MIKHAAHEIEFMRRVVNDPALFALAFFAKRGYLDDKKLPAFGHEVFDLIQEGAPRTALILPRKHLKTTLVSRIYALWYALTHPKSYVVVVTSTEKNLFGHTSAHDRELRHNEKLVHYFGPQYNAENWNLRLKVLKNESTLAYYTANQQIRGALNHLGRRPDLIILDDIETLEQTFSEAQTEKLLAWFVADVEPALGVGGRIILVNNIIAKQSLTYKIASGDFKGWKYIKRAACNFETGTVLWPEHPEYSVDYFKNKIATLPASELHRFWAEWMNEPREAVTNPFPRERLQRYEKLPEGPLRIVAALDIAYTEDGDHTGWAVGFTDRANNLYVATAGRARLKPHESQELCFRLVAKWRNLGLTTLHIEGNHAYISMLQQEQARRNEWFRIVPLEPKGVKKSQRIMDTLDPALQYMYFHEEAQAAVDALAEWNPTIDGNDDLPDAVTYLRQVATRASPESETTRTVGEPAWMDLRRKALTGERHNPTFKLPSLTRI